MKLSNIRIILSLLVLCICFGAFISGAASSGNSQLFNLVPESSIASSEDHSLIRTLIAEETAIPATADGEIPDDSKLNETAEPLHYIPSDDLGKILIYHTHTTEAYRQTENDTYTESGNYRTNDNEKNVVAVGALLKSELESLGFTVIHDTTDHEPPKLSTSYSRSLKTMEKYTTEDIDIYIDLHRDASGASNINDVVEINGEKCARMMFVVGKGLKSDGTEYDPRPNFDQTYAFANAVRENVLLYDENFMREIRIKNGRYNQHLSDHSLLLEVGHNMNTLEEAKNSIKYFARALYNTIINKTT